MVGRIPRKALARVCSPLAAPPTALLSKALLQRGFVTGSILTVDPDEAAVLGQPWTRRYIYNQQA